MRIFRLSILFLFVTYPMTLHADEIKMPPLCGEQAPKLTVSKWLQGDAIEAFDTGRVYVIYFWGTWCGPCVKSMPKLSRIQEEFSDEVTVAAISVFEFQPDRVPTYFESIKDSLRCHVGVDSVPSGAAPNLGLTVKAWLGVSDFVEIPKIWIVDQQGKLAWFGRIDSLENTLRDILDGTWDQQAYTESYRLDWEQKQALFSLGKKFSKHLDAKEWEKALACATKAEALPGEGVPENALSTMYWPLVASIQELQEKSPSELRVAESAARRLVAIRDSHIPSYEALVEVLVLQGKLAEAEDLLEIAAAHTEDEEVKARLRERATQLSSSNH